MSRLSIYLFGGFQALLDNEPLAGVYDHVRALLTLLAAEPHRVHRRDALAELLWPNESEDVARRNLRQALSRLRGALGDRDREVPFLLVNRNSVQFNRRSPHYLDVAAFLECRPQEGSVEESQLTPADLPWLEEAAALYRGHFLDQFYLPDNLAFDQWITAKREEYKHEALTYLRALTRHHSVTGNLQKAIAAARRQIELEPWLESAHRQLMELLGRSEQRAAALAQYNTCEALLQEELGIDPEPETMALRDRILEGRTDGETRSGIRGSADGSGRRQVTALYCGLEEPAGMDPEDLLDIVRGLKERCGELAHRYDAHLEPGHGGSQLLVFGYPRAHEDDARRAVQAGLEILAETRRLNQNHDLPLTVRAGAHTGLLVAAGGNGESVDLLGAPISLAMQLRFLAGANSLLISADTHRLIESHYATRPHTVPQHAEIAPALPASQVLRAHSSRQRPEFPRTRKLTPFVGREAELQQLLDAWRRSRDGEGQVVQLVGEPGMGKTRLLLAFKKQIAHQPHTVRQLRCQPHYQATALQPVIELLYQICDFRNSDSNETKRTKLSGTLAQYDVDDTAFGLLAGLLNLGGGEPADDSLAPFQRKQQTLDLIATLQRQAAEHQPVVWIAEDLQWVDPSTLELLKLMKDGLAGSRVLMLLTYRPAYQPPWSDIPQIPLTQLDPQEIRRLASHVANSQSLPAELLEQLVDRTDGIPLFVEELTKTLLETPLLQETDEGYALVGDLTQLALPATLHDSLMARLDRLGGAKRTAQLAAVIGRDFAYDVLAEISDLDESSLQATLQQLVEAELIDRRERGADAWFSFRHALIQETAYESLLRRDRQELHSRLAALLSARRAVGAELQPELLAQHFTAAGQHDEALDYWLLAGTQASQQSAHSEAVSHFRRGLEVLAKVPESASRNKRELSLQIGLGMPLMLSSGPVPEMEHAYARALELSQRIPNSTDVFPAIRGLYSYYAGRADYQTSERLAYQLLGIAKEQDNEQLLLEAHRALGTTFLLRGELNPAAQHLQHSLALYRPDRDYHLAFQYGMDPGLAALTLLSIFAWTRGYPDHARKQVLEAVAVARERDHPSSMGWALNIGLIVLQLCGDAEGVLELSRELNAMADRHHMPMWTLWSGIMRDKALAELGHNDEAIAVIQEDCARYDKVGASMGRPYAFALWAEICLEAGHHDDGLSVVTEALSWVNKHNARLHEAELHRLQGELLLAADGAGAEQAEAAFQRALALSRAQGCRSFELRAATSICRLWFGGGRHEEGMELLKEVYSSFEEGLGTRDLREARALLERKAPGRHIESSA